MMESFLEDAESCLHHRHLSGGSDSDSCSGESSDPMDDPFLYDKFISDPDWAKIKEQEEMKLSKPKNAIDPGPFRYNKRVFVTSLPAIIFILALGGETLVMMVCVAVAVLTIMAQLGDSRRCIISFIIMLIPVHTYTLCAVLPLLWLSMWHVWLCLLINMAVVLTAGWVMLQFQAFRTEETGLACVTEQLLFTLHPVVCTTLVTWALSAVLPLTLLPVFFSLMWFVLLQLYLVPTLSSFRTQTTSDENLDVVQVPIVSVTVVAFVLCGPVLHVVLALFSWDSQPLLSITSLIQLVFNLALTAFLATLLSIRQIFEFLGLPYTTAVYVRWVSGVVLTAVCYPVLSTYGLDSHFLPLLPVAISMFAALGVVLAFRRRRLVMAVLALVLLVSLTSLFLLWIQGMPHNLQHYFMGIFPLNMFYLMICANFFLCLLITWTASLDNLVTLGLLLGLQSIVVTICELSLHNHQLYSTALLQLSSVTAVYCILRLHTAEKLSPGWASVASAVQVSKSLASISSLVLNTGGQARGHGDGEVTLLEVVALAFLSYSILSVFVYNTVARENTPIQIACQVLVLMCGVAVAGHHLLLPLSMVMFQGSTSYSNIIGLWCLLCGGLLLLYSQTPSCTPVSQHVLKLALCLSIMGVVIIIMHPHLHRTFMSLFQWLEIVNGFCLVTLISSWPSLSGSQAMGASILFAVCPGLRLCLYLWSDIAPVTASLCFINCASLLLLFFVCFLIEWTQSNEKLLNFSLCGCAISVLSLMGLDMLTLMTQSTHYTTTHNTLLSLPAWKVALLSSLIISVLLKVVHATKEIGKLPLVDTERSVTACLPVVANCITVLTFVLACSQGPGEATLHDVWCCASTMVLACLHGDGKVIPQLSGHRLATPTLMTSVTVLLTASLCRSRLWSLSLYLSLLGGLVEVVLCLLTLPIFLVLWGVMWNKEIISEPMVVFCTPYTFLLVMVGSSYSSWLLALSAFSSGVWLMMYKLPMVPYNLDYHYIDR